MARNGVRYTKDFKLSACRLVTDRGYSIGQAAKELGVSDWSLRQWLKKFKQSGELVVDQQSESVAAELKQLRAENARLRMEKDILKKAAQFFARESR